MNEWMNWMMQYLMVIELVRHLTRIQYFIILDLVRYLTRIKYVIVVNLVRYLTRIHFAEIFVSSLFGIFYFVSFLSFYLFV